VNPILNNIEPNYIKNDCHPKIFEKPGESSLLYNSSALNRVLHSAASSSFFLRPIYCLVRIQSVVTIAVYKLNFANLLFANLNSANLDSANLNSASLNFSN